MGNIAVNLLKANVLTARTFLFNILLAIQFSLFYFKNCNMEAVAGLKKEKPASIPIDYDASINFSVFRF